MIYSRAKFDLYRIYKDKYAENSYSISGVTGGSHSQHREAWFLSLSASPTFVSCYRTPSYRHANKPIAAQEQGDQNLTSPPPHPCFCQVHADWPEARSYTGQSAQFHRKRLPKIPWPLRGIPELAFRTGSEPGLPAPTSQIDPTTLRPLLELILEIPKIYNRKTLQ